MIPCVWIYMKPKETSKLPVLNVYLDIRGRGNRELQAGQIKACSRSWRTGFVKTNLSQFMNNKPTMLISSIYNIH